MLYLGFLFILIFNIYFIFCILLFEGLSYLKLDNNPLLTVDNSSFADMKKLKYLSLDVINTTSITAATMRGLGRLKTLAFGTIARETLPSGIFETMRSLRHLSVQDGKDIFRGFAVEHFRTGLVHIVKHFEFNSI